MPYMTDNYGEWIEKYFCDGEFMDNKDIKYYGSDGVVLNDLNDKTDDDLKQYTELHIIITNWIITQEDYLSSEPYNLVRTRYGSEKYYRYVSTWEHLGTSETIDQSTQPNFNFNTSYQEKTDQTTVSNIDDNTVLNYQLVQYFLKYISNIGIHMETILKEKLIYSLKLNSLIKNNPIQMVPMVVQYLQHELFGQGGSLAAPKPPLDPTMKLYRLYNHWFTENGRGFK